MRVIAFAIAIGLCVLTGGQALALPTGSYDQIVSVGNDYIPSLLLGNTLDFDYWFETTAEPGSYAGQSYDVMVLQTPGDWAFLGQVGSFYTSTDWRSASLTVPLSLVGQQREVRFHVSDYGPETDPVVYLRNVSGTEASPVPEPASLLLLGTGIMGWIGFRVTKKTA